MKKMITIAIMAASLSGCAWVSYEARPSNANGSVWVSGGALYPDLFGWQTKKILEAIKKYIDEK